MDVGGGMILGSIPNLLNPNYELMQRACGYIFYFSIGYVFEYFRKEYENILSSLRIQIPLFLFLLCLTFIAQIKLQTPLKPIFGILFMLSLCCILDKFSKFDLVRKILFYFSASSFMVYLLHDPINLIALKYGSKLIETTSGTLFYYFLRLPGNILICLILTEIIKFAKTNLKNIRNIVVKNYYNKNHRIKF